MKKLIGSWLSFETRLENLSKHHRNWDHKNTSIPITVINFAADIDTVIATIRGEALEKFVEDALYDLIENILIPRLQTKLLQVCIPAHLQEAKLLGLPGSDGLAV